MLQTTHIHSHALPGAVPDKICLKVCSAAGPSAPSLLLLSLCSPSLNPFPALMRTNDGEKENKWGSILKTQVKLCHGGWERARKQGFRAARFEVDNLHFHFFHPPDCFFVFFFTVEQSHGSETVHILIAISAVSVGSEWRGTGKIKEEWARHTTPVDASSLFIFITGSFKCITSTAFQFCRCSPDRAHIRWQISRNVFFWSLNCRNLLLWNYDEVSAFLAWGHLKEARGGSKWLWLIRDSGVFLSTCDHWSGPAG